MKFSETINYIVGIFDNVLEELGQSSLLSNKDFIFRGPQYEDYLELKSQKINSLGLSLHISDDGLEIHTDETPETYTYGLDFIENNEGHIKKTIKMLFTSTVRAEHCGKNYIKLFFIDGEGNVLDTFTFMEGFISLMSFITGVTFCRKANKTEKIYDPIYLPNLPEFIK